MIFYNEESRKQFFDDEFRKLRGLPTERDEAIQIAAEKEVDRRVSEIEDEKFAKDVRSAADKMDGPSAKEADRQNAWISMPDSLKSENPED